MMNITITQALLLSVIGNCVVMVVVYYKFHYYLHDLSHPKPKAESTEAVPKSIKGISRISVSWQGIQSLLERNPLLRDYVKNNTKKVGCSKVNMPQTYYFACSHGAYSWIYDDFLRKGFPYEADILAFENIALNNYGPRAIYLDIGANIGSHSLYHLVTGKTVVAVEAMPGNILDLSMGYLTMQQKQLKNLSTNFALFEGGVHEEVGMLVPFTHKAKDNDNGHFRMVPINQTFEQHFPSVRQQFQLENSTKPINATTLHHILSAMPLKASVIMKVDIEGSECLVFQDPSIFNIKSIFIPYIFMEVTFLNGTICNISKFYKFLDNLQSNNYTPAFRSFDEVKASILKEQLFWDALFVHANATPLFPTTTPSASSADASSTGVQVETETSKGLLSGIVGG